MSFRVLVVDDSMAMRGFIRRAIGASGLDVTGILEAGDGVEALELLHREWVDVILTDINMPRMNGEEFSRRLLESGEAANVPIIVVSTDATSVRMEHLRKLGARGYLVKPFPPEALREEIERVLGAKACVGDSDGN